MKAGKAAFAAKFGNKACTTLMRGVTLMWCWLRKSPGKAAALKGERCATFLRLSTVDCLCGAEATTNEPASWSTLMTVAAYRFSEPDSSSGYAAAG